MRPLYLAALAVITALGGCAEKATPLTLDEKAHFVTELLDDESRCDEFRTRLAIRPLDGSRLDTIYRQAMQARCVKRDV